MLALYNPFRDALKTYRKYNVADLQGVFRSIMVLKNRFGDCDVEIGVAFYGWINYFRELPSPEEINDYEVYKSPIWAQDVKQDKDEDKQSTYKFTM